VEPESARADPNAVEASRLEARDTVDTLLPTPAGCVEGDLSAASGVVLLDTVLLGDWTAPPGEPQMSQ